jgi:cytochrome c-type biogenesis protein CcmE
MNGTGRKLAIALMVVAGVTCYMAYLGGSSSWRYYLTVDECLANTASLGAARIRVSGRVAPDSLCIAPDGRQATFSLAGAGGHLPVVCSGPLPDNLAENKEVVVEGRLENSGSLRGEKVLTRCSGKYKSAAPSAPSKTAARAGPEQAR